jgi:hypothetical protein
MRLRQDAEMRGLLDRYKVREEAAMRRQEAAVRELRELLDRGKVDVHAMNARHIREMSEIDAEDLDEVA